jgi:hypothetical protein
MNKITDELLNKFIDNELTADEVRTITQLLQSDNDLRKRLEALKIVHKQLQSVKQEEVSANFTRRVMQRISGKYKVPKGQKLFITIIISFFSVLCVSIFGFILINIAGEVSDTVSSGAEKTANNYSQPLIQIVGQYFQRTQHFGFRFNTFNCSACFRIFLL